VVEPRKLKRATIKEELVALTNDAIDALLLNHFLRCQAMARHVERYIEEERARFNAHGERLNMPPTEGWFYKKSDEMSEETMLGLSRSNMRARIAKLVEPGWIEERDNPFQKWDKTKQYRVNIRKLDADLRELGYHLDGWLIEQIAPTKQRGSRSKSRSSEIESRDSDSESRDSVTESGDSDSEYGDSDLGPSEFQDRTAIPSSTTSINNKAEQQAGGAPQGGPAVDGELIKKMAALNVTVDVAIELAETAPEECARQLEYLLYREGRTNKAATLVKAIRERWAPPDGWVGQQEAVRREEATRAEIEHARQGREQEAEQRRAAEGANAVLDQMFAALDPRQQARVDEEARDRLGVLGRLGQNEAALQAMRRTLLRERLSGLGAE